MDNLMSQSKNSYEVQELLEEVESTKGFLNPHDVVDAARPADSPLHKFFDWDDHSAGERYRVWQARGLINSQKIHIKDREVSKYISLVITETEGGDAERAYVTIEKVMSNQTLRKQAIAIALKELMYWQEKYKDLAELDGIINKEKLERISNL